MKFITSFCSHFDKIVFCDALKEDRKRKAYVLDLQKTGVCPLPNFTVYSFWRNLVIIFPKIYRIIRNNIHKWDVVWLHAPHPVSLIFAAICMRLRKPFFLFIRQNLKVYVGRRNRGVRRTLAVSAASALEHIFRLLSRYVLTFAVGGEIFYTYRKSSKKVYQTAVSLVSEKDLPHSIYVQSPHNPRQIILLSVGRLDPEKGLGYLIQAVDECYTHGRREMILNIVGKGSEEKRLRDEVRKRGIGQIVRFVGYVTHGHQLFKLYKESHIFVLPSLTEGYPQTLFEAMAFGVPIIATRVGGIPDIIRHNRNGLLVDSSSPKQLYEAIDLLAENRELRLKLVQNGLKCARAHTMEAEKKRIMFQIESFLKEYYEDSVLL